MSNQPNHDLESRVVRCADVVLKRDGFVTYPTLFREMGLLAPGDLDAWRKGRIVNLERVVCTNLTKLARIQTAVRRWAKNRDLTRARVGAPKGRRYSKSGQPWVESEYATLYRATRSTRTERSGTGDPEARP
ncbi:MAG: hypothetical protein IPH13_11725 [Planctomycetes bacterium]|nr:hypothetical protein [Planctomycetota bacterium]MCC7170371.1 hypothetical protein [Planctomycetota bacterium]